MAIPGQRRPGQTGGGNHWRSQASSRARGGSPRASSGGGGKKGGPCLIWAIALLGIPATIMVLGFMVKQDWL